MFCTLSSEGGGRVSWSTLIAAKSTTGIPETVSIAAHINFETFWDLISHAIVRIYEAGGVLCIVKSRNSTYWRKQICNLIENKLKVGFTASKWLPRLQLSQTNDREIGETNLPFPLLLCVLYGASSFTFSVTIQDTYNKYFQSPCDCSLFILFVCFNPVSTFNHLPDPSLLCQMCDSTRSLWSAAAVTSTSVSLNPSHVQPVRKLHLLVHFLAQETLPSFHHVFNKYFRKKVEIDVNNDYLFKLGQTRSSQGCPW